MSGNLGSMAKNSESVQVQTQQVTDEKERDSLGSNQHKIEFIESVCESATTEMLKKLNLYKDTYVPDYDDYIDFDNPLYTCFKAVDDDADELTTISSTEIKK